MDRRTIYGGRRKNSKWVSFARSHQNQRRFSIFSDDTLNSLARFEFIAIIEIKTNKYFAPLRTRSTTIAGNSTSGGRPSIETNENSHHNHVVHQQQRQRPQCHPSEHSKAPGDRTPNHMAHALHKQRCTDQRPNDVKR